MMWKKCKTNLHAKIFFLGKEKKILLTFNDQLLQYCLQFYEIICTVLIKSKGMYVMVKIAQANCATSGKLLLATLHPIWECYLCLCLGFLLRCLQEQQKLALESEWTPATDMGDPHGVCGSCLRPGPAQLLWSSGTWTRGWRICFFRLHSTPVILFSK